VTLPSHASDTLRTDRDPVDSGLPTAFLREQAAAGGIALINSMGAFGGFVGPYLIGRVKERTGEFTLHLHSLPFTVAMAHPRPGGDLRLTACVRDPIVFARSHLRPPTTGARGNRRQHCRSPA
jgi:hypothetical protein